MPISETNTTPYRVALLHLGFRPFFLLGSIFSAVAVLLWFWLYGHGGTLSHPVLSPLGWHAHEMIYGYAVAVVAGFLLTAVRNWTGVQTTHGVPLLLLALLWLLARLMPFVPHPLALPAMAFFDLAFNLWLCWEVWKPIHRVKQWQQLGVWAKVLLLLLGNAFFYLGLFGLLEKGERWGLYTGLYIILSLVLLMGRRVIPFFIERGVGYPVQLRNHGWLDRASLVLMLLFWLGEVFVGVPVLTGVVAGVLFALHALRLWGWHTRGIWRVPLLWVLYLAYGWLVAGFLFRALAAFTAFNPFIVVHAFAYGGIGLLTLGMMARVAYGHTGRNVFDPPRLLTPIFLLLFAGSLVRVVAPLLVPSLYGIWITGAQWLWIVAFVLFIGRYAALLWRPRVDGAYG